MIKVLQNHIELLKKSDQFLSTNSQRLKELNFDHKFLFDNYQYGFGPNIESLISFWSNPRNFKSCRIAYVEEQNGEINSFIWWLKSFNEKIGKKILIQYIWLSFDPKNSIRLLNDGLKFAEDNNFDGVVAGNTFENKKLKKFLIKKGFQTDPEIFYKKIN